MEFSITVGALAVQLRLGAIATEGAFEATDQRIASIRREIFVATLAIRAQLKHCCSLRLLGWQEWSASSIQTGNPLSKVFRKGADRRRPENPTQCRGMERIPAPSRTTCNAAASPDQESSHSMNSLRSILLSRLTIEPSRPDAVIRQQFFSAVPAVRSWRGRIPRGRSMRS